MTTPDHALPITLSPNLIRALAGSRWLPLVASTPSGKAQYVCLCCGTVTVVPGRNCSTTKDPGEQLGCSTFEAALVAAFEGLPPLPIPGQTNAAPAQAEPRPALLGKAFERVARELAKLDEEPARRIVAALGHLLGGPNG